MTIDEERDEADACRAQEAYDHNLDLESERADCDPAIEICAIHGEWIPASPFSECSGCIIDESNRGRWIDPKFFPTRYGDVA